MSGCLQYCQNGLNRRQAKRAVRLYRGIDFFPIADWASEVLETEIAPLLIVTFADPSVEARAVNQAKAVALFNPSATVAAAIFLSS